MNVLTLNAGSSSLKYKLYSMPAERAIVNGTVEHVGGNSIVEAAEKVVENCHASGIDAVGHRVVHGGSVFKEPVRVTDSILTQLRSLKDLDPLHNPAETAMIATTMRCLPTVPTTAAFDTAFHRTMPEISWRYALPRSLCDAHDLRRYGFHGLSYEYVTDRLLRCLGRSAEGTKLIICHLGSGASVCAVKDGLSCDTSMGLTPLAGLIMGTRSGDIDPGLVLYLLRTEKMTPDDIDDTLNYKSGLLGVSGLSSDVRQLEEATAAGNEVAEFALNQFAYCIAKYIGSYMAAMNGADTVAFTGGIGENSADVRSRVCAYLAFLGLQLDQHKNEMLAPNVETLISADGSRIHAWVIPTDEQRQIARSCYSLVSTTQS